MRLAASMRSVSDDMTPEPTHPFCANSATVFGTPVSTERVSPLDLDPLERECGLRRQRGGRMGMHAAMVTTWGSSVPGREGKAIEAFMDYLTLMGKRAADDKVTEPEAYFKYDGSGGMGVVRGDSAML